MNQKERSPAQIAAEKRYAKSNKAKIREQKRREKFRNLSELELIQKRIKTNKAKLYRNTIGYRCDTQRNHLIWTGGICFICGITDIKTLELHHVIGRENKNAHKDDNIIGLCANCHRRFHNKSKEIHCFLIGKHIESGFMFNGV